MKPFNVINYDFNKHKFEAYDVMPYLVGVYKEHKKNKILQKHKPLPVTREEFKEWVKDESMYQFWARCEYEIILVDWPNQKDSEKWDVYRQIEMNLDTVVDIFMENIGVK